MKSGFKVIPIKDKIAKKEIVLKTCGLYKSFRVNGKNTDVLNNISFTAFKGEFISLFGPSGCGKSTILKIISGFLKPDAGNVNINGKKIDRPGPDRCVIFQEDALFPWLTVEENIGFGLRLVMKNKKALKKEVERFLALVDLTPFRNYLPREISGGMKQRVALARVLILRPKVLLMDEPFAALDAQAREDMQRLLISLWEKFSHTILFVTHDVSEAVSLSDRIIIMGGHPGRIKHEIRVNLERPRKKDDKKFSILCKKLYNSLL